VEKCNYFLFQYGELPLYQSWIGCIFFSWKFLCLVIIFSLILICHLHEECTYYVYLLFFFINRRHFSAVAAFNYFPSISVRLFQPLWLSAVLDRCLRSFNI
jgi:hypothetical protein